jgi:hypothetical protein
MSHTFHPSSLIALIVNIFGEEWMLWTTLLRSFSNPVVTSFLLISDIILSQLFSDIVYIHPSFNSETILRIRIFILKVLYQYMHSMSCVGVHWISFIVVVLRVMSQGMSSDHPCLHLLSKANPACRFTMWSLMKGWYWERRSRPAVGPSGPCWGPGILHIHKFRGEEVSGNVIYSPLLLPDFETEAFFTDRHVAFVSIRDYQALDFHQNINLFLFRLYYVTAVERPK